MERILWIVAALALLVGPQGAEAGRPGTEKVNEAPSRPAPKTEADEEKAEGAPATAEAAAHDARAEALAQAADFARVRSTLGVRRRAETRIEEMTVRDALKFLGEIGGFGVVFDQALEEAGIDLEFRRVTMTFTGMTYEQALKLLLPREVGYKVEAGYILVTTLEKSWLPLQTRIYSILLATAAIPNFGGQAPRFEVGDVTEAAAGAAGGTGFADLFGGGGGLAEEPEETVTPERIIDLILRHVRHENDKNIAPWDDIGGPASIQYIGGRLIVSQTPAGHAAVMRIISMIE